MGAHWTGILIVIVLLVLLFGGRGKISGLMGDLAKGVTEFRKGLRDTPDEEKSTTSQSTAALNERILPKLDASDCERVAFIDWGSAGAA